MKFKDLPIVVKVAVLFTFFNTWVIFEECVIDRFGYWQYLPMYKKGIFCTWDILFILIFVLLLFPIRSWINKMCVLERCKLCS
ncbi:MAG: hypothetical protein HOP11_07520 [Saprospiraceae bacterium]|nr:hypothetical protein [Saprospiraceae bacterium]